MGGGVAKIRGNSKRAEVDQEKMDGDNNTCLARIWRGLGANKTRRMNI